MPTVPLTETERDSLISRRQLNDSLYTHSFDRMRNLSDLTRAVGSALPAPTELVFDDLSRRAESELLAAIAGLAAEVLERRDVAGVVRRRFADAAGHALPDRFWRRLGVGLIPPTAVTRQHLASLGFGRSEAVEQTIAALERLGDPTDPATLLVGSTDPLGRVVGLRTVGPTGFGGRGIGGHGFIGGANAVESLTLTSSLPYLLASAADGSLSLVSSWTSLTPETFGTLARCGVRSVTLLRLTGDDEAAVLAAKRSRDAESTPEVRVATLPASVLSESTTTTTGGVESTPSVARPTTRSTQRLRLATSASDPIEASELIEASDPIARLVAEFERSVAGSRASRTIVLTPLTPERFERRVVQVWSGGRNPTAATDRLRTLAGRYRVVTVDRPLASLDRLAWATSLVDREAVALVDATSQRQPLWWQRQTIEGLLAEAAANYGCRIRAVVGTAG